MTRPERRFRRSKPAVLAAAALVTAAVAVFAPAPAAVSASTSAADAAVLNAYGQISLAGGAQLQTASWTWPIARGMVLIPGGGSGYLLDGFGGVHPFGGTSSAGGSPYWPGWDIARAIALNPCDATGKSGYVLDGFGGVHAFGEAPAVTLSAYWKGWDIARGFALNSCAAGYPNGYVLDGYGGLHSFWQLGKPQIADAPPGPYWKGWDIARGVVLTADGQGEVLDGYGGIHRFGGAPAFSASAYWPGWDIARGLAYDAGLGGGYVLDGYGNLHAFGSAAPLSPQQVSWGRDTARAVAVYTGPTLANEWVNVTAGASPQRCATPCAYDPLHAFGSLDAAFAASSPGDGALVKCGTYGVQNLTTVHSGPNVVFQSEAGRCATISVPGGTGLTFGANVGNVTIDGFTINGMVRGTTSTPTTNDNIVLTNNAINVGQKTGGPDLQFSVGNGLTISDNIIGPSCCGYNGGSGWSPEGIRIGKPNSDPASCNDQMCNLNITGNLIQYVTRDCQYWPSSGYGSCPDTTCPNSAGCHEDGIHIWGIDGGNISGNRLYGVECQGIYLETTNNSLNRNVNIDNNAISTVVGGCGNKGIYLSTSGSNNWGGTFNVRFNSGNSMLMVPDSCTGCAAGTVFNLVGNATELYVFNGSGNAAGCVTSYVNYLYNVWQAAGVWWQQKCGANDKVATSNFVNAAVPPATGIDLHLATGTQPADNYVPAQYCVSADIDGQQRPANGVTCDAGADER